MSLTFIPYRHLMTFFFSLIELTSIIVVLLQQVHLEKFYSSSEHKNEIYRFLNVYMILARSFKNLIAVECALHSFFAYKDVIYGSFYTSVNSRSLLNFFFSFI